MSTESIRTALNGAIDYLTQNRADARATDSYATATMEDDLRCTVTGPDGATAVTDMVPAVGGANSAPSPGWLLRAAIASCVATLVTMKAALEEVEVGSVEVTVDSESDDLGILGIDDDVPAGPMSVSVRVKVEAPGSDRARVEEIVRWAEAHCPVSEATRRAVPLDLAIDIS